MRSPRMRPVFHVTLARAPDEILRAMDAALEGDEHPVRGVVMPPNVDLRLPDDERHFWSPVLCIRVLPEEDGSALLQGRFAPHPQVWTMFMAIYLLLAMVGIGGAMYGASQYMLERAPWALILVPISIAAIAFVYGAAFIGQGLGAEQMYGMRSFVDHVLEQEGLPTTTMEDWSGKTRAAPG